MKKHILILVLFLISCSEQSFIEDFPINDIPIINTDCYTIIKIETNNSDCNSGLVLTVVKSSVFNTGNQPTVAQRSLICVNFDYNTLTFRLGQELCGIDKYK